MYIFSFYCHVCVPSLKNLLPTLQWKRIDKIYFSFTKITSWQGNLVDSRLILGFLKFLKWFLIEIFPYKSFRGGSILRTGYIVFSLSCVCAIARKYIYLYKHIFGQGGEAIYLRVCYQRGQPCLVYRLVIVAFSFELENSIKNRVNLLFCH